MRVAIVVFEGFDELDAIGPYEVLTNAALGGAEVGVDLVAREAAGRVTGSHGLAVEPQGVLDGSYDLVVVPGGNYAARSEVGAWGEIQRGELPAALRRVREEGAALAAVCTGAMLLAAAGAVQGRRATTNPHTHDELREAGAELVEARVVDDGDLVTCGGVTAGIDMALWLVEREWGAELAGLIARGMDHERRGPIATAAPAS